ncbi:MAG: antibiotic biosynthesis monooxygenase [Gilvibacter sp.]
MTVRIWEGHTKNEHAALYQDIIEQRDIPNYKKTDGFLKLSFLKRSNEQFTYFKLLTYWRDIDAVINFTGPNYKQAKGYDEDVQFVVNFPGTATHYEVFEE